LKQIESLRVVWTLACILVFQICIPYRLFSNISHPSSSAGAPRSDRATPLQVDEEANHGHTRHCLMFALPYCIDPASTVHYIFFSCIEIWRPTYKLTKRRSASATPSPSGVCATKLYLCSRLHLFSHRDFSAPLQVDK